MIFYYGSLSKLIHLLCLEWQLKGMSSVFLSWDTKAGDGTFYNETLPHNSEFIRAYSGFCGPSIFLQQKEVSRERGRALREAGKIGEMLLQLLDKPPVWESVSGSNTDLPFTSCETLGQIILSPWESAFVEESKEEEYRRLEKQSRLLCFKSRETNSEQIRPKKGAHWGQQECDFPERRLCLPTSQLPLSSRLQLLSFSDCIEFILLQPFLHLSPRLLPLQSLLDFLSPKLCLLLKMHVFIPFPAAPRSHPIHLFPRKRQTTEIKTS